MPDYSECHPHARRFQECLQAMFVAAAMVVMVMVVVLIVEYCSPADPLSFQRATRPRPLRVLVTFPEGLRTQGARGDYRSRYSWIAAKPFASPLSL